MMRFALSMFVLTLLAPQPWALGASYQDVHGPKDKAEKNTTGPHVQGPKDKAEKNTNGPQDKTEKRNGGPVAVPEPATITRLKHQQDKTEKRNGEPVAVPEPATITLLAAGAGVAVARKLWTNRQR